MSQHKPLKELGMWYLLFTPALGKQNSELKVSLIYTINSRASQSYIH